ncbi:PilZ domain-containing protein [Brevibacillus sp. TJ4]|uniref:PilZ domain-containing protein n=1 Tax=Brevibacillus sp. TJ4 TaxID=3234853 RepID=UPI003BA1C3C7
MTEAASLQPFLAEKQLQRGASLQMMLSSQVKQSVPILVEHAKAGYIVVSCEVKDKIKQEVLGSTVRIRWKIEKSTVIVECLVIQEQTMWPVRLLGLIPTSIKQESVSASPVNDLLVPDTEIRIPYKVMGARPIEEKGEGVLLKLSPTRLVIGTEGYIAKKDFIHLSFVIPSNNQEVVGMAQVVEKSFEGSQAVMELQFTDISDKHYQLVQDYYNVLLETV